MKIMPSIHHCRPLTEWKIAERDRDRQTDRQTDRDRERVNKLTCYVQTKMPETANYST